MDVTLPNGQVIRGIPEGTPKDVIMQKAISSGLAQESDFSMPKISSGNLDAPIGGQVSQAQQQETTIGEDIIGGLETAAT